jgi:BlaI family penicillinase repressor
MGVTQSESRIMEALWAKGPMSADEIEAEVAEPQGWGGATVRTLIHRLLKRQAIRSERAGGRVRYQPVLLRADYLHEESQSLLDRLFDGRLAPLVAHFASHRTLSPDEIKQLRALLEELDDDR